MEESYLRLLVEVAQLYYEEQLTQEQIGKKFGLSRSKISRLLTEAREKGLVKIFIFNPYDDIHFLESKLRSLFSLKAVRVIQVPMPDDMLMKQVTGNEASSFIARFLKPYDRIGVGWGITLYEVAKSFPAIKLPGAMIVQLSGGIDNAKTKNYANEIVQLMANKLETEAYTLPCPAMVDSPAIAEVLMHDAKLSNVFELGRKCNKMLVSIGVPDSNSCLTQAGYLKHEDLDRLQREGAIGIICNRFYDINGQICDEYLDQRTLGVRLSDIKQAECVIACVAGLGKAKALLGALNADLIDVLIVDSITAKETLQMVKLKKEGGVTAPYPS
jgi:deoxyribonucleoside regulator